MPVSIILCFNETIQLIHLKLEELPALFRFWISKEENVSLLCSKKERTLSDNILTIYPKKYQSRKPCGKIA